MARHRLRPRAGRLPAATVGRGAHALCHLLAICYVQSRFLRWTVVLLEHDAGQLLQNRDETGLIISTGFRYMCTRCRNANTF